MYLKLELILVKITLWISGVGILTCQKAIVDVYKIKSACVLHEHHTLTYFTAHFCMS